MNLYTLLSDTIELSEEKQQDIILRASATNIINLYCVDENDNAVDITGATIYFVVKEKPTDTDASAPINLTITSFTNPGSGHTEIEIIPESDEDLEGNYLYEIRIVTATDKEYILAEGNVTFKRSLSGVQEE